MNLNSLLLYASIICLISSCNTTININQLDSAQKQTFYNVSYGENERHIMNIALPKNRNEQTPVIVFVHGGAWMAGDKDMYGKELLMFSDSGFACVSVNYRYASLSDDIHHPALLEDIRMAIDYIASQSKTWNVSDNKFGITGHSAGAHLAMLTSYSYNKDHKIKACASWAGPVDFFDAEQAQAVSGTTIVKNYMGRELRTSQDTFFFKSACPYYTVDSHSTPTLLVYGTADGSIPYSNAIKMHHKLVSNGVDSRLYSLDNANHNFTKQYLDSARSVTLQWFKEKL